MSFCKVSEADKGAYVVGLNVAYEAELAGDKAKKDYVEVDEEAEEEDQEEDGGLG